ncbi:DUF1573 domain-containing protein [Bacteroidales bacterium OttesenSCG-928-E04]|nr:DUF1573 domain-containing protein [Bacteroidales bacterium OttesenSCG-928-E04]
MKKILLTILCVVMAVSGAFAQQEKKAINGPEIEFDKSYFDVGEVKIGEVKEVTVTLKNIGNRPLFLDEVISSCDCTEVEWSKAPVLPGKTATIKATYTAKDPGIISKRVTVLSNAETDRVILEIKGKVVK